MRRRRSQVVIGSLFREWECSENSPTLPLGRNEEDAFSAIECLELHGNSDRDAHPLRLLHELVPIVVVCGTSLLIVGAQLQHGIMEFACMFCMERSTHQPTTSQWPTPTNHSDAPHGNRIQALHREGWGTSREEAVHCAPEEQIVPAEVHQASAY
eukprot:gene94-biopygen11570